MSEEDVRRALMLVEDPEAGMNIVDLGLVYAIRAEPGLAPDSQRSIPLKSGEARRHYFRREPIIMNHRQNSAFGAARD